VSTVRERLDRLYAIGGGDGADRPGLSAAEEEAYVLVEGWMREAGLATSRDAAGNLFGRLAGRDPELPEVWTGSHLDSVPAGGRFDGALGVLAGLEALSRLTAPPARTVAVVAFRDEEGWRFGEGFFGSRAATGTLTPATLARRDAAGVSVAEALDAIGIDSEGAPDAAHRLPAAYVELHIEQGPVLAAADAPVGVVSSIVGLVELGVTFEGSAGHAGTTPMAARRDAGLCAAAFQVAAAAAARALRDAVATVGTLTLSPGASNVVPQQARLVVDARAPDDGRIDELETALRAAADGAAAEHGCSVDVVRLSRTSPVVSDPLVTRTLRAVAPDAPVLPSGAGHDAQILGVAGVPVGMIFVRSLAGGVSHSPLEDSSNDDVEAGVEVLASALPALCEVL
jgi:allantoate deiminase